MARTFNALIIGAGKIGASYDSPKDKLFTLTHAHSYTRHPGFKLIGFYDVDQKKAAAAARKWKTKSYKSLSEAFSNNDIDVVSITVPDDLHFSILRQIIKYRPKLVFVEKPLATSKSYGERIIKLYKKFRIPLLVNYNRRFTPEFISEREKIVKGTYGKFLGGVGYYGKGILHNGSHMINTLRFFFEKVSLHSVIESEPDFYEKDPSVSAVLNVADKKFFMRHINSNLYTIFEFDLLFEKTRLRFVDSGFNIERHKIKNGQVHKNYRNMVKDKEIKTTLEQSLYYAADNIFKFLKGKEQLICDGEVALNDLKLCLTISNKAKINKKIMLFSNDTGGANMVFPLVKPLKDRGYKVFLYGKSLSLPKYSEFGLKGLNITREVRKNNLENITKLIKRINPNFIVTGTSAKDPTERFLWQAAAALGIPNFAILDSWVNYEIRFSLGENNGYSLPTKICVVDDTARKKVFIDGLSEEMLITTGNPYFEILLQKNREEIIKNTINSTTLENKNAITVLFISEPISKFYKENFSSENYLGYTEKTILYDVFKSLNRISKLKKLKIKLLIKLHPQDDKSNYDNFIKKFKKNTNMEIYKLNKTKLSNWQLINSADIV